MWHIDSKKIVLLVSIAALFCAFSSCRNAFAIDEDELPFAYELPKDWQFEQDKNIPEILHCDLPGKNARITVAAINTRSEATTSTDLLPVLITEGNIDIKNATKTFFQTAQYIKQICAAHRDSDILKKSNWITDYRVVSIDKTDKPSTKFLVIIASYAGDDENASIKILHDFVQNAEPKLIGPPFRIVAPEGWKLIRSKEGNVKSYTYIDPNDNAKLGVYVIKLDSETDVNELEKMVRERVFVGLADAGKSDRTIEGVKGKQFALKGDIGGVPCKVLSFVGVYGKTGYVVYYIYCQSADPEANDTGLAAYRSFRIGRGRSDVKNDIPKGEGVVLEGPKNWIYSKDKSRERGSSYDSYTFMEEKGSAAVGVYVFPSEGEFSIDKFLENFEKVYAVGYARHKKQEYIMNQMEGTLVIYRGTIKGRDMLMKIFVCQVRFETFVVFMVSPEKDEDVLSAANNSWKTFRLEGWRKNGKK